MAAILTIPGIRQLPLGEVRRKHSPLASGFYQIENGVPDF
jgi:hypothetical protein